MQLGFTAAVDIITGRKKCEINFKFNVNYSDWQSCANRHSCTKNICMPGACAGAQGAAQINRPSENGQIQTFTKMSVKHMNKHTSPGATEKSEAAAKNCTDNSNNRTN